MESPSLIESLSSAVAGNLDMALMFEQGIWTQHLQDQKNYSAVVQGVRYFFAPDVVPVNKSGGAKEQSKSGGAKEQSTSDILKGTNGYICVTSKTARLEGEGLRVSLDSMKDVLTKKKAWEANRRGFGQVVVARKSVPVIFMSNGRPQDRRFGASDCLLGLFTCVPLDPEMLSCKLIPCSSGCGAAASETLLEACFDGKGSKRRRRTLPIYSTCGLIMGPSLSAGLTGAHAKDMYIQSLQRATNTVRLNAFCISDPDILEELRRATVRGVRVKVRYDFRQQNKTFASCFEEDRFRLIEVHPVMPSEDEKIIMHKKELLIDAEEAQGFALMGSYNPTVSAKSSQESVVSIKDPAILPALKDRFDYDWKHEEESYLRQDAIQQCPNRIP